MNERTNEKLTDWRKAPGEIERRHCASDGDVFYFSFSLRQHKFYINEHLLYARHGVE